MLKSINTSENTETISFHIFKKDTIAVEKRIENDSLIPVDKFVEDVNPDSIPEVPKIEIPDTSISDSVISETKLNVSDKFKKHIPIKTREIKDYPGGYLPEELTWNTSDNFLIQPDNNDTATWKNSIAVTPFQNRESLNIEPVQRDVQSNDWLLGLFMFVLLLFLWVKTFYKKYFSLLFGSLFSYQVSLKLMREKNIIIRRVSFVLNFIYAIVLATFILKTFEFYKINIFKFNTFETLLILINFIIIISLIRFFILNIIGLIFNSTQIFNEYIHNNFVINKNLGLFLFPLLIMLVYINEEIKIIFIVTGISLIIISYIIRLYRGFQIIIKKDIFLFYLILYLCTLEILPVLLGYKLFFLLV